MKERQEQCKQLPTMSRIKGVGTENEEPGGPLITACLLRVMWREGTSQVVKATGLRPATAPGSTAGTSSRRTRTFHFPPFLPSSLCPPHARQDSQTPQCLPSASRESSKGLLAGPTEGTRPPQRGCRRDPGTLGGRDTVARGALFFFFFCKSSWSRGGKTLQIHVGQGSVGQQIRPEGRLFELSGRKKDCPGTELKWELD